MWENGGNNSLNRIPHFKGVEEAFGIDCLYELRGTIGSIADELTVEILCDWPLVSSSKVFTLVPHSLVFEKADTAAVSVLVPLSLILADAAAPQSLHLFLSLWCSKMLLLPQLYTRSSVAGVHRSCSHHSLCTWSSPKKVRQTPESAMSVEVITLCD